MAGVKLPANAPSRVGLVLFPQFELLDAYGPINAFTSLSRRLEDHDALKLYVLAETLDPVWSGPIPPDTKGQNFSQKVLPTHTFDTAPDIDLLVIPGGIGTGDAENKPATMDAVVEYVQKVFDSVGSVITICTGSGILARAGLLDGHRATTNKAAWKRITPLSNRTYWVAKARWVESDKIWTTSGVSAGTDGTFAWMSKHYGEDITQLIVRSMEYFRQTDPNGDPYAEVWDCHDVPPTG